MQHNPADCSLGVDGVFIRCDWLPGRNTWFSGGAVLDWPFPDMKQPRFDLNTGYYFQRYSS